MDLTTINSQIGCQIIEIVGKERFGLPYNQKILDNGSKIMNQITEEEWLSKLDEVLTWGRLAIQFGKAACAPLGILLP